MRMPGESCGTPTIQRSVCASTASTCCPATSDAAGIRVVPGSKVFHVQLADAPRLNMDVVEWSRHHRMFPGLGSFDLAGFVGHVLTTGYDGPLSLEVFNDVYRQADPRHAAIDGMRSLLALQEAVCARGPAAVRERLQASGLPPAPRLGGHVFTELAVDDVSGPDVARALAALGFVHSGQHRSKPVQLWQQGSARILLNFAPQRTVPPGTAAICALGIESADPAGSAQRAERLLAPVLPRTRQPEEADLSSVAAPDGTAVFFFAPARMTTGLRTSCRPAILREPTSWLPGPTASHLPSRSTTSTKRRCSTAPCSACEATETDRARGAVRPDPQPVRHRSDRQRPDHAQHRLAAPR